jgi:hypothetical protein
VVAPQEVDHDQPLETVPCRWHRIEGYYLSSQLYAMFQHNRNVFPAGLRTPDRCRLTSAGGRQGGRNTARRFLERTAAGLPCATDRSGKFDAVPMIGGTGGHHLLQDGGTALGDRQRAEHYCAPGVARRLAADAMQEGQQRHTPPAILLAKEELADLNTRFYLFEEPVFETEQAPRVEAFFPESLQYRVYVADPARSDNLLCLFVPQEEMRVVQIEAVEVHLPAYVRLFKPGRHLPEAPYLEEQIRHLVRLGVDRFKSCRLESTCLPGRQSNSCSSAQAALGGVPALDFRNFSANIMTPSFCFADKRSSMYGQDPAYGHTVGGAILSSCHHGTAFLLTPIKVFAKNVLNRREQPRAG